MKKEFREMAIVLAVVAVGSTAWVAAGWLLAPRIPPVPQRADSIEARLESINDSLQIANSEQRRREFLQRWGRSGVYLAAVLACVYGCWRGVALTKRNRTGDEREALPRSQAELGNQKSRASAGRASAGDEGGFCVPTWLGVAILLALLAVVPIYALLSGI